MARYSNVFQYTYNGKTALLSQQNFNSKFYAQFSSTMYKLGEHDRLDTLAYQYYGDGSLWWIIAQANDIELPTDLNSGDIILIPLDSNTVLQAISTANNF